MIGRGVEIGVAFDVVVETTFGAVIPILKVGRPRKRAGAARISSHSSADGRLFSAMLRTIKEHNSLGIPFGVGGKSKFGLCYDREGNLKTLLKDSCNAPNQWKFGKRNRSVKVSKAKAMKAFRSFWKRHCAGRRSRFGNGGNPMLNASMGYEFCPNGLGGVLGANSTGLFPSPCMSSSSSGSKSMAGSLSGAMTRSTSSTNGSMTRSGSGSGAMTASAFGKRRRVRSAFGRQHMMPDGTMSAFGRRPGRPRKHRARSPTAFGRRPGRPRKYRARSTRCSMYD